jgi:hypothetical protein
MTPTHDLFEDAKSGSDKNVGENDKDVGVSKDLRNLFRRIWPKKTAAYLAIAGDVTVRQAERILAGQGIGAAVLTNLLRSEHGAEVLEATMRGAMPPWWKEAFHERRISAARRKRQAAERELRELEDEA